MRSFSTRWPDQEKALLTRECSDVRYRAGTLPRGPSSDRRLSRHSASVRPLFAHLLNYFMRQLLAAQIVVRLAATVAAGAGSAHAANDQSEGSGLPLPRFA